MSSSESEFDLKKFVIPLDEIVSATQNFSQESWISKDGFGDVFKGQLENRKVAINCCRSYLNGYKDDDVKFLNEVIISSRFHHQNIIPFIGYFHEGNLWIRVSEYAVNGRLNAHLEDPDKRRCLTWENSLKICIGAARGLEYLHSGLSEDSIVIHRDMKSYSILLDDNLEAKISNFCWSIFIERNQPQANETVAGSRLYIDPVYEETGIANTEADVYSFGVVLFEMLSGTPVYSKRSIGGDEPQTLINLVRRYYAEGLHILIDPYIRDEMNIRSFNVFKEIAYQCISWNLKDRPTMDVIIKRIGEAQDFQ